MSHTSHMTHTSYMSHMSYMSHVSHTSPPNLTSKMRLYKSPWRIRSKMGISFYFCFDGF